MRGTVGILDDDPARVVAMRDVLGARDVDVAVFEDVADFLAWALACPTVLLLSLDHDLGASRVVDGEWRDPGIGMDVVQRLLELPPSVPVIVHSSNPIDAPRMAFLLGDAGWRVDRVVPHDGTTWIRREWAPVVDALLDAGLEPSALVADEALPAAQGSLVGALERLADLHDRGALDDDEFVLAKRRILGEAGG